MNKQHQFDNAADSRATLREYPWNRLRYEITHDFIRQNAPQRIRSVLNIGCGDGFESYLFSSPDVELTLTDCSEKMLEKAQEIKKEETFYRHLKELEMEMAQKFPYFNIARFGLFLCRKLTWESGC